MPAINATLCTPGCYVVPSDGDTPFLITAIAEPDNRRIRIRASRREVEALVQDLQELLEASK